MKGLETKMEAVTSKGTEHFDDFLKVQHYLKFLEPTTVSWLLLQMYSLDLLRGSFNLVLAT